MQSEEIGSRLEESIIKMDQSVRRPDETGKKIFDQNAFLEAFSTIGTEFADKYSNTIKLYSTFLLPNETNLKGNIKRAESFFSDRQRMDLLNRVEKLTAEKTTLETAMLQLSQRYEAQMLQNSKLHDEITGLKHTQSELQANLKSLIDNLDDKMKALATVQEDKNKLVAQLEEKSNEYNKLLESYMRDNNMLAQKLNNMNILQQQLHEKEKKLEEDRFYLENQKKQFLETKNSNTFIKVSDSVVNKPEKRRVQVEKEQEKSDKVEFARTPFKKIIKHHTSEIYCLASSYNGNLLASCGGDRVIKLYDPLNLKTVSTIQSNSAQNIFVSLNLNYLGDRLVTGSMDKSVCIYSSSTGKQLGCLVGHGEKVNAVAFTNSKEKCASGSDDRQLKFWDLEKGANVLSVGCGKSVKVITPNLAEPVVYSGHGDGSVRVYSINQGNSPMSQLKGLLDYSITSITLSSNRNHVLVGSKEGSSLNIFDIRVNKCFKTFKDEQFFNSGEHFRADYTPTQSHVVAGNYQGNIFYWNIENQKKVYKLTGHQGTITSVLYNPFNNVLSSSDSKGNLILWN